MYRPTFATLKIISINLIMTGLLTMTCFLTGCGEEEQPVAASDQGIFLLKQGFWLWEDDFIIKDENEIDIYLVDGKAFSWRGKISFQDMNGNELAFISQKMFGWKPKYEIYKEGQKFAEVIKEVSWFKSQFTLDVPGTNDYNITGSFWGHEYNFERQGKEAARVSKKYWSWSDTYGIEIVAGEDDIAILATCVVIDLICHGKDKR